jgi:GAF domain-containing protein
MPRNANSGPDERLFLEAVAGQCALALERARLYEAEHHTASALQASLLPARLPELPGVQVAARFVAAEAADAEVGGRLVRRLRPADRRRRFRRG